MSIATGERNVDLDICRDKVEDVNLDVGVNFRGHIRGMRKKVGGMIGTLRRLKNLISVNATYIHTYTHTYMNFILVSGYLAKS